MSILAREDSINKLEETNAQFEVQEVTFEEIKDQIEFGKFLYADENGFIMRYVDVNTGQNLPASNYGVTLARPWKSIRYACEQVLAGALRENAGYLLKRNRNFIVES